MNIEHSIKQRIADAIAEVMEIAINPAEIGTPPNPELGDFAYPCFAIAKKKNLPPVNLARDIASNIRATGIIAHAKAFGPYVNFFVDAEVLAQEVLDTITAEADQYGYSTVGGGKRIVIEYSQPNTHKVFHIGHVRNACLGSAIIRLCEAAGLKPKGVTYVNDFGAHVAQFLYEYRAHKAEYEERLADQMGEIYAQGASAAADDPAVKAAQRELLIALQNGTDRDLKRDWKKTRDASLDDFARIYALLGVSFDKTYFESDLVPEGRKMVADLQKRGILKESDGAIIADLSEYNLDVLVIVRSDGTTQYPVADLPLSIKKVKDAKAEESYCLIDVRQGLYLKQLSKILQLAGFDVPLQHIAYEFVTLPEGAMSSRKGTVVSFDDVYRLLIDAASFETRARHEDWDTDRVQALAQTLAIAALKYAMLMQANGRMITFDAQKVLSFDGNTGPYLLYALVRLQSVLDKAGNRSSEIYHKALQGKTEKQLLLMLGRYTQAVTDSQAAFDPSVLAHYLFELASLTNVYYHDTPILRDTTEEVKNARLALVAGIARVVGNGLDLLGIPYPKEM